MSGDVSTIAALLAKAERTDNPHEAEAYLAKAQHLATLRSVDLAMVRARAARTQKRVVPVARTVRIGEAGKRANTHLVSLFVAVAHANDVGGRRGAQLHVRDRLRHAVRPRPGGAAVGVAGAPDGGCCRALPRRRPSGAPRRTEPSSVSGWDPGRCPASRTVRTPSRPPVPPSTAGSSSASGIGSRPPTTRRVAEASAARTRASAKEPMRLTGSASGATTELRVLRAKAAEVKAFHQQESPGPGQLGRLPRRRRWRQRRCHGAPDGVPRQRPSRVAAGHRLQDGRTGFAGLTPPRRTVGGGGWLRLQLRGGAEPLTRLVEQGRVGGQRLGGLSDRVPARRSRCSAPARRPRRGSPRLPAAASWLPGAGPRPCCWTPG